MTTISGIPTQVMSAVGKRHAQPKPGSLTARLDENFREFFDGQPDGPFLDNCRQMANRYADEFVPESLGDKFSALRF